MKLETKKKICSGLLATSIITILGTISFAYFTGVAEVRNPQRANVSTGSIRVTFSDNDDGVKARLDFDESVTKKFTIENIGTLDANIKLNWVDLVNTYIKGSLTYTLEYSNKESGPYTKLIDDVDIPNSNFASKLTLARNISLPAGAKYYYNLIVTLNNLKNVNQLDDLKASFSTRFEAADANSYNGLLDTIIASSHGERTSFDSPATTDEGVYELEDDYGTSYYFRGDVKNNYVKFGKNKNDKWMWWRIVRINGDGSLRLQYDGVQTTADENSYTRGYANTYDIYNERSNDVKYIGWMYGPAGTTASTSKDEAQTNLVDSNIKKIVDSWYKENLIDTKYSDGISDTLFCNDRSIPGKNVTNWSADTELGYGNNLTGYGAVGRFITGNNGTSLLAKTEIKPTFKCPQKNDAFTVSDKEKGNGSLTYPVGLITVDELVAAGSGRYFTYNTKYFPYKSNQIGSWTMSPAFFANKDNENLNYIIWRISTGGQLYTTYAHNTGGVSPVINLTIEYAESMIGSGILSDPYRMP